MVARYMSYIHHATVQICEASVQCSTGPGPLNLFRTGCICLICLSFNIIPSLVDGDNVTYYGYPGPTFWKIQWLDQKPCMIQPKL
ncbi:hypothetical protein BDR03DRAFT_963102 [Suillus americanus]|nr:hypothetical protein BDR03DRAFT_963102 [Suillus americanus]